MKARVHSKSSMQTSNAEMYIYILRILQARKTTAIPQPEETEVLKGLLQRESGEI
jgi:hypothetical protein